MTTCLDPEIKAQIDGLTRIEMARLWRFAPTGHILLSGEAGKYFGQRFGELGGFSTEISKAIGWGER